MKEQNGSEKKKGMSKEKKFYLFTAIGCAVTLVAIILVAVLLPTQNSVEDPTLNKPSSSLGNSASEDPGDSTGQDSSGSNEPVINTPEGMMMPVETVSVMNDFGFYHNKTLNNYYEHKGVDFTAEVGTAVLAVDDGVVESIYKDDVLTGTEITVDHGDGVKTVYRFIDVGEDLTVGTSVKRGDVIGTVAEATGEEYKDGAHLHFEIKKDGKQVDPATYLTFEEK
ncbi:MAG: M23 family metallopeptidase [Clostridia bacterium]|nr:M23 family metallopeptidase [Clostridia bacterium]